MSVEALPCVMLGARSRLRPLPMSLVGGVRVIITITIAIEIIIMIETIIIIIMIIIHVLGAS